MNKSNIKPNTSNIRQGQTIYYVWVDNSTDIIPKVLITSAFLCSEREELPEPGNSTHQVPPSIIKQMMNKWGAKDFHYSYKKAITSKQQIVNEICITMKNIRSAFYHA
jgi:hypothetical protein